MNCQTWYTKDTSPHSRSYMSFRPVANTYWGSIQEGSEVLRSFGCRIREAELQNTDRNTGTYKDYVRVRYWISL